MDSFSIQREKSLPHHSCSVSLSICPIIALALLILSLLLNCLSALTSASSAVWVWCSPRCSLSSPGSRVCIPGSQTHDFIFGCSAAHLTGIGPACQGIQIALWLHCLLYLFGSSARFSRQFYICFQIEMLTSLGAETVSCGPVLRSPNVYFPITSFRSVTTFNLPIAYYVEAV